jgi:hypothetical protein
MKLLSFFLASLLLLSFFSTTLLAQSEKRRQAGTVRAARGNCGAARLVRSAHDARGHCESVAAGSSGCEEKEIKVERTLLGVFENSFKTRSSRGNEAQIFPALLRMIPRN